MPGQSADPSGWPPAGATVTAPATGATVTAPAAGATVTAPAAGQPPAPGHPPIGPTFPAGANQPYTPPGQPYTPPGQPYTPPGQPYTPSGQPYTPSGQPYTGPGQPYTGPVWPAATRPANTRPGPGRWLTVTALVLAAVLTVVTGVQAYQIHRLGDRLGDTDRRLAQAQDGAGVRLDGLEQRAGALEKQAGAAFNPEAIASAVLPSVFRVRAGQFTGTAFAVGKPVTGGGTNLFTNFHVVEGVWNGGGREVFLERTDQRFPATIVKVDETNDIAHLRTTGKFTGLVAAPAAVKPGQQIVVVGAPLGLADSVTTGVVSAFRKAQAGEGPVIQFDAPINPGNSGGPVINGSKQVVGIATAKARDAEGIGLAVPIDTACDGFKIC
ncbi:trypsin-like peptidase domain-containing protein [Micromonospora deserti]|uniref:S1C family serine protease n=1 Tax=Micromonospora deserti TaxID=2070366 RepID=UPI003F6971A2